MLSSSFQPNFVGPFPWACFQVYGFLLNSSECLWKMFVNFEGDDKGKEIVMLQKFGSMYYKHLFYECWQVKVWCSGPILAMVKSTHEYTNFVIPLLVPSQFQALTL